MNHGIKKDKNPGCAVIVFAKAPLPGYAKTRLEPVLGPQGAARLAARMIEETLKRAIAAEVGPVELCCAPDASHWKFQQAAALHGIALTAQGAGDLGERMNRALTRSLKNHRRVVLIGTDVPDLGPVQLREAAQALLSQPAVFAPAVDGGYVLVGLAQPMPLLFRGIAWSTRDVMTQTRQRLNKLGVTATELALMRDVDEAEDLAYLPREWLD